LFFSEKEKLGDRKNSVCKFFSERKSLERERTSLVFYLRIGKAWRKRKRK
jgi:hypothetical protein